MGFPAGSAVKNPPASAGDGRSPEGGNGDPLQYSCLGNPVGRGASRATVHGITKSRARLSEHTHKTCAWIILLLTWGLLSITLSETFAPETLCPFPLPSDTQHMHFLAYCMFLPLPCTSSAGMLSSPRAGTRTVTFRLQPCGAVGSDSVLLHADGHLLLSGSLH